MSQAAVTSDPASLLNFGWRRRLPLVRQTEATECGLASLAMIAGYHGASSDLNTLRRHHPLSAQGTNLKTLIDIASSMHLSARALKADLGAIAQLQTPCILHWDMNHFVVLKGLRRRHALIHDPARGELRIGVDEFARHYTGIALELTPSEAFKPENTDRPMRLSQLWTSMRGLTRSLLQILLLSVLIQLYAIAAPFFVQTVVDDVVLRGDTGLLKTLALGFGLLLVIEAGTRALRSSVILQLSSRLHLQLAANLFRHLIRLPLDYFQRRHLGDVLSRFSSLDAVREVLSTGLVSALVDGLMAILMLVVMFIYDVRLTLIVLAIIAVYLALRVLWFPPLRRLTEEGIAQNAKTETSFMESVRAIQTIKLYQRENERQSQWQNRLADAMNTHIRLTRMGIGFEAANVLLFGVENILVVFFAAQAVMANTLSLGMFFAFISYKQRFVDAIDNLITQGIEIKMLDLHLQRISDIAFTAPESIDAQRTLTESMAGTLTGELRAKNLAFRYSEADPPIFEALNFSVRPGKTVAIVGPSGCGKSTLLKCIMGLLTPSSGEIILNGIPIERQPGYRSAIAAVMQDDQLMSGSIADNIACFDHRLDLEKVTRCAQMACIHDDILRMPMQYNTLVGDMGASLSGGQAQRIMLARAFYRQPGLLFLDEATSHLDLPTERKINQHIADMRITRVIVAHRPDTIALADHIIELRQGSRETVSRNGA